MMNPPIATFSPVFVNSRVEMLSNRVGVGLGVGVGVALGVGVGVGVGEDVAVTAKVKLCFALGITPLAAVIVRG
jgi:hypothetical protein